METIKYDKRGRIEYNPEFHARQQIPWTKEEDEYLMKYYKFDGRRLMSFALEKTETAVCSRYHKLKAERKKTNDKG